MMNLIEMTEIDVVHFEMQMLMLQWSLVISSNSTSVSERQASNLNTSHTTQSSL
jgi:hypothetical protein